MSAALVETLDVGSDGLCELAVAGGCPARIFAIDLRAVPSVAELGVLSDAERKRAARFVFARDRRRYLAAHYGLRAVLASCVGIDAERIAFSAGPHGKPMLDAPAHCRFNMTHSEDLALVAVVEDARTIGEVGIDLEWHREMPDALDLGARHFTPAEAALLARGDARARTRTFFDIWTRKEACLKAVGTGLTVPAHVFECGAGPCDTQTRIPVDAREVEVDVRTLAVASTVSAAIAFAPLHDAPG